MSHNSFNLKNAKQRLSRQLHTLQSLLLEAQEFKDPWDFPLQAKELDLFLTSKKIMIKNLMLRLSQRRESINEYYATCNQAIDDLDSEDKTSVESQFDAYWTEKEGEVTLSKSEQIERNLEKRLVELECQEQTLKQELMRTGVQTHQDQDQSRHLPSELLTITSLRAMDRRLLGNELKIPSFYGDPSDFPAFWELFDELVHKQPYSNIEKLSILINCCKGDAARSLQMIPRTSDSYERAVQQLKRQYEDPRRITMQMIHKLKSRKRCGNDLRSLRNNLSDIQAIIATLERQGEVVNTTNMRSMVLDTFPRDVQEEMARKEFDSGNVWSMTDLLENLVTAVRRKEHVNGIGEHNQDEHSVFHTTVGRVPLTRCTGCGQQHKFQFCDRFISLNQKIGRLRELNACWKCFSRRHRTEFCRKQNCFYCGGQHNTVICKKGLHSSSRYNTYRRRGTASFRGSRSSTPIYSRGRSYSPRLQRNRSFSPNSRETQRSNPNSESHSTRVTFPESPTRSLQNRGTNQRSPSPSRSFETQRRVRFRQSPNQQRRPSNNVTVNLQLQNKELTQKAVDKVTSAFTSKENVRLMIVPVRLKNLTNEEMETVFALLDSASDQSFISTPLARRLKLKTQSETNVIVNTFGGKAEKRRTKKVTAQLYNQRGNFIKVKLLTSEKITPPLQVQGWLAQDESFIAAHFGDDDRHWFSQAIHGIVLPEILIGMDYFNEIIMMDEPVIRLPSGLFITSTFFGPVLSGVPRNAGDQSEDNLITYDHLVNTCSWYDTDNDRLDISDIWKLNTIGIEETNTVDEINEKIVTDFYSTVQIRGNVIFVRFPWKPNRDRLADNYNLALSRLHQLFKMKQNNPQCWTEYCNIINEQLERKFIEDAPLTGKGNTAPVYYMPHQAVLKSESTTTKTRIVLDASSKMKGELSLNDVIYQGPLILPNICGILLRSRIGSKLMIADVEKAFHMIHLHEADRDAVRFLWLQDVTQPPLPGNLRVMRFCRLPFGINASPFLLGISIKYGIEQQATVKETFKKQLNDNLYVDNVLLTEETTEALLDKYKLCKQTFNNISINLRQFLSNDLVFNSSIPHIDLSTSVAPKILGIQWNNKEDMLTIKCKLPDSPPMSKRKVLRAAHSTFDPLGLLTPLLIPAKIFLQDLWKHSLTWDEPLPPELSQEWRKICEQAAGYETRIPRAVTNADVNNQYELHTFVDASLRSFAAATYLRMINSEGTISSCLLMARHRLAPINRKSKTMSIPRLELLALLIGTRLTDFILTEAKLPDVKSISIYSDSEVALHWIQSNKQAGIFVDNRCAEIRNKLQRWKREGKSCLLSGIPSALNPADCATKGVSKHQMPDHFWWKGPSFLRQEESMWPKLQRFSFEPQEHPKQDQSPGNIVLNTRTAFVSDNATPILAKEISSITKYKRILALVLKFLKSLIYEKVSEKNKERIVQAIPEVKAVITDRPLTTLQAVDIKAAETTLIKLTQKTIPQKHLEAWDHLRPYKDELGIIRCRGRINTQHLAQETLEPILLPPNQNFTFLLVKDIHARCGHQGTNGTLANIRRNYWIPKGRQVVKKCLKSCLICKRWNSRPFFYPDSPPLPPARTQPSRPFSHIGIDMAGPFHVKSDENKELKRWILLSTCMATRAVHLEVATNLSALELISVLRRLVARRGKPQIIISDNATNFTTGRDVIKTMEQQSINLAEQVRPFLTSEAIEWKLITPLSPWKGGFYERMIGIMKSIFKRITNKKRLNDLEFTTLVIECEAMINSRPLTYAGSTLEDSVVLRPIDFLIPFADINLLPSSTTENENKDNNFVPQFNTKEAIMQQFTNYLSYLQNVWTSWTNHYLLELRNFHQKRIKQKSFTRKRPHIGEVVLIMDERTPRGEWPLGLVTEVITDSDDQVRSVKLRTAKHNITRSINMLIPLEIEETSTLKPNTGTKSIAVDPVEVGQQSANEVTTPAPAVNEKAAMATSSPAKSIPNTHIRPSLPRRAKQNITYSANAAQTHIRDDNTDRSSAYWHRWIILSLLATLCTSVQANEDQRHGFQCIRGGIAVKIQDPSEEMIVCAEDHCINIRNPNANMKVIFPAEITLHSHQVLVKLLQNDTTKIFQQVCQPSPYCEQIACTFCVAMLANPECWPRLAIALAGILVYLLLLSIYITVRSIRNLFKGCRRLGRCLTSLRILYKHISRQHNARRNSAELIPLVETDRITNSKWTTSTMIRILTIIAVCPTIASACQQTIIIPTTVEQCISANKSCANRTTTIAKFNTMQMELCLHIQRDTRQVHFMKITLEELIFRCQKETLYFTQNTQTFVQYRKRCPHMGSCTGTKCAQVSPDTLVDELDVANNYTGITYCSESCGGLGCSCGFPSSGCLFYRVYQVPTTNDIYEVFHCPSWYETAKIKIEYGGSSAKTFTGEVKPYHKQRLGRTHVQVLAFNYIPNSIFNKRFLTNFKATTYLDNEVSFSYACMANPASETFNKSCSIRDTCNCNPAEDSVSCYCTHNNISHINRLANILPLQIPNGIVEKGVKGAPKLRTRAFSAELALYLDPKTLQIQQEIHEFNCNIVIKALTGCYNCIKGATATIWCASNTRQSLSQALCGLQHFILTCTKEGTTNEIKMFFNRARIKEQCNFQCGSQMTVGELRGVLNYVNGVQPLWKYTKIWTNKTNEDLPFNLDWDLPDFTHFIDVCKSFYLYTVTITLFLACAIFISTIYACADKGKGSKNEIRGKSSSFASPASSALPLPIMLVRRLLRIFFLFIRIPLRIVGPLLSLIL